MADPAARGPRLDAEAFAPFRELLEACQDFAELSGCRFQRRAFEALPVDGPLSKAKAKALPAVALFAQKLQDMDQALLECVERAHRFVMNESVRSGIVATCREVGLWPPDPPPLGVSEEDCTFQDTTAPLPVIAQRAYNDEARRCTDASLEPLLRRAMTASFIVDFAGEAGLPPPPLSESHSEMLTEFMLRVEEWAEERGNRGQTDSALTTAREALVKGLSFGEAAKVLQDQVAEQWTKNWETPTGALMNVAAVGLALAAGVATLKRAARQRS